MAYKGTSNFTGAGANGMGGKYQKGPGMSNTKPGFNQTTTFVEPVWDNNNHDFRAHTRLQSTTVSDGASVIRNFNTPA